MHPDHLPIPFYLQQFAYSLLLQNLLSLNLQWNRILMVIFSIKEQNTIDGF